MSKKWIVIIGIVVVLAIIGAVVSKDEDKAPTAPKAQVQATTEATTEAPTTQEPAIEAASLDELTEKMIEAISNTEPNTSARVDAIASFAKKAAKQKNEHVGNEAVIYIVDNYPNYFGSNEQMEKVILCGYFLEYLDYAERVTQIGQDVEQAVKYVYRGEETADSEATKLNLEQIWEIISSSELN